MRIKVDPLLCELHGRCAFVAPELFRIEDDNVIYQEDLDPRLVEKAEKAVRACPQQAIKIED